MAQWSQSTTSICLCYATRCSNTCYNISTGLSVGKSVKGKKKKKQYSFALALYRSVSIVMEHFNITTPTPETTRCHAPWTTNIAELHHLGKLKLQIKWSSYHYLLGKNKMSSTTFKVKKNNIVFVFLQQKIVGINDYTLEFTNGTAYNIKTIWKMRWYYTHRKYDLQNYWN